MYVACAHESEPVDGIWTDEDRAINRLWLDALNKVEPNEVPACPCGRDWAWNKQPDGIVASHPEHGAYVAVILELQPAT